MIHFENVSKTYGAQHHALQNINFHLKKGEMAFLTGHSGAGKSTLLKLIMMMEPINSGKILLQNKELSLVSRREVAKLRRSVGMIFQNPQFLSNQTIFYNVALPLIVTGRHSQKEINFRTRAALDKVGLLAKEKILPDELSTGEQQRASIARAIVNKPPLILADEPTGNLDPTLSAEIMGLFEEFNQAGVSVFVATHDLALIATMHCRILTLKNGRLIRGGNNEK